VSAPPRDRAGVGSAPAWLALSLAVALVYGGLAVQQAFRDEYVVQDDARQHVFWMQRFVDPELFAGDSIAEYFASVAPPGYSALYRVAAAAGINPFVFNKLLPVGLGLVTTSYAFAVTLAILPVPGAAFLVAVLLNQSLWMAEDLASATPRAFVYPFFLAFCYYLLRGAVFPCLAAIALQALFYPHLMPVMAGVLVLEFVRARHGPDRIPAGRRGLLLACGVGLTAVAALFYSMRYSEWEPVVTASVAREMPEFQPGGRAAFFSENPWSFWVTGRRSGVLPDPLLRMIPLWAGILLPLILRSSARFPLARRITPNVGLLAGIVAASLVMFVAAHVLLFKLHLPSRYTGHTLRIALAVSAGIALAILGDKLFRFAVARAGSREARSRGRADAGSHSSRPKQARAGPDPVNATPATTRAGPPVTRGVVPVAFLGVVLLVYPFLAGPFPRTGYVLGKAPDIYRFFAGQPEDTVIASIAAEADNLPSFSGRSILAGREYAIPYHVGYYQSVRRRAGEIVRAQYAPQAAPLRQLVERRGVDFFLLERDAFSPGYLRQHRWRRELRPEMTDALAELERGTVPALARAVEACRALETPTLIVVRARCVALWEGGQSTPEQ
jgi:hypothetical protein